MKIVVDIPAVFDKHFNEDRFEDSLERIRIDTRDEFYQDNSASGNYELELLDMLIEAFKNAESVKCGRWDGYFCTECNERADYFTSGDIWIDEKPNFCPNCGARMDGN